MLLFWTKSDNMCWKSTLHSHRIISLSHACECACACSFSHHKIFSPKFTHSHRKSRELLNSLNFFCFSFNTSSYINIDWSLAMRLRMRVSFLLQIWNSKNSLCMGTILFAFHVIRFRWPFPPFVYLFIYLLALRRCWNFFFLSNLLPYILHLSKFVF